MELATERFCGPPGEALLLCGPLSRHTANLKKHSPPTLTANLGCVSQSSLRAKSQWKLVLSHRLFGFRKGIHKESVTIAGLSLYHHGPGSPAAVLSPSVPSVCYLWATPVLALEPGVHVTTSGSLGVKLLSGAPAQRLEVVSPPHAFLHLGASFVIHTCVCRQTVAFLWEPTSGPPCETCRTPPTHPPYNSSLLFRQEKTTTKAIWRCCGS